MDIPTLQWEAFLQRFKWEQGEHITLVGPTGQGKTMLSRHLLDRRRFVVVFATKRKDPMIDRMKKDGYALIRRFDGQRVQGDRYILQPPQGKSIRETRANQKREFGYAMEVAYEQGSWCVVIDEGKMICDTFGLTPEVEMLLQGGRTLGVSVIMGVQRPVKIPLAAYDQATHLFFFREGDEANLKRIGGIGGVSNKLVREAVSMLESHQVLYLNTRNGEMAITKAKVR